jgi:hypothetical protein
MNLAWGVSIGIWAFGVLVLEVAAWEARNRDRIWGYASRLSTEERIAMTACILAWPVAVPVLIVWGLVEVWRDNLLEVQQSQAADRPPAEGGDK